MHLEDRAIHKYYICSTCARMIKPACKGRSVRMDTLDNLVVDHLSRQLFTTERLTEILAAVLGVAPEQITASL